MMGPATGAAGRIVPEEASVARERISPAVGHDGDARADEERWQDEDQHSTPHGMHEPGHGIQANEPRAPVLPLHDCYPFEAAARPDPGSEME